MENNLSKEIFSYLINKKKYSIEEISEKTASSISHITNISLGKENLTPEDINHYLDKTGIKFWEFAIEAIDLDKIPQKLKDNIIFCQECANKIKISTEKK